MESFRPGKVVSARALNQAEKNAFRATAGKTGPPLETVRSPIGDLSRMLPAEGVIWATITGKLTEGLSPPASDFCYSGQQQLDLLPGAIDTDAVDDEGGGIEFFADTLPLVEVSGNPNVPAGSIVRAFQGNGPYYVFGGASGSTGVELIKINPPTFYLGTGGVTLCFYDGTILAPTIAAGWATTPTNVWWVTKYADALVDPLPGQTNMTVVTVDGTKAYPGKFYGESYDPVNVGGSHVGSRPVYWWPGSAWGILEGCDDSGGVPVVVLDLEG